jgi:hypothetical protein
MPIAAQPITTAINANPTGFLGALSAIDRATKDTFGKMGLSASQVTGPFDAMKDRLGKVTVAIAAVTATMVKAVNETARFTEESMDLGRALGASAAVGGSWLSALEDVGASTGEVSTASRGLLKNVRDNEEALNAMGLVTRTASGELRSMDQLMLDAIQTVNGYREGTDRNLAAQAVFGKGVEGSSKLLKLNSETIRENKELQEEMGLVVGDRAVAAFKEYDQSMDRLTVVMKGLWASVGQVLMPVFTQLADFMVNRGPAAARVLRGAISPFAAIFNTVAFAVQVFYEGASMAFENLGTRVAGFIEIIKNVASGDWEGAKAAYAQMTDAVEARSKMAADAIGRHWDGLKTKMGNLWSGLAQAPDTSTPGAGGGAGFVDTKAEPGKDSSVMAALQAQLEARKYVFEMENQGREFSKAQELAFWREILETTRLSTKDQEQAVLKFRRLEVEVAREAAKLLREIDASKSEGVLRTTLAEIDAAEARAEGEVTAGRMTQASLLTLQREFNEARLVEEIEFQDRKRAVLLQDPDRNLAALEQLEQQKAEIRERYAAKGAEIMRAQATEARKPIESIVQSFQQSLGSVGTALLSNWRNLGSALRGILANIGQSIIQEVVTKPLIARIAGWAKERALTMAGIGADAAKAGSGAASSQASIPYVGPILAIAAMAAILAAVGGMSSKVPSAAGGFDIPKGMNPLTQLHEREMVLPANLADTVRNMAAAGGGDAAPRQTTPVQLRAANVGRDFLMMNRNDLAAVLRTLGAEFKLRP